MVSRDDVALAVSLDIVNAFNTMPWDRIVAALEHFEVPSYLVRLIRAYLNDRWVCYTSKEGEERLPVERSVPQGSVLGPILWITAYDEVLCGHGMLRGRHSVTGRRSRVARDVAHR